MPINLNKSSGRPRVSLLGSLQTDADEIRQIPVSKLIPFDGQPFKPYSIEKMERFIVNIKENGIINPIIVRPLGEGKYQILAGHNRTEAAKLLGMVTVPCIVKECDDRSANLIMVDTNLEQREELLPSERAFAYKIKKENSSVSEIAKHNGENRKEVQRYLRLTELIPPLLDKTDKKKLPLVIAVELSYLSEEEQQAVYEFTECHGYKVTAAIAKKLRIQSFSKNKFTSELLLSIFKPIEKVEKRSISFRSDELNRFFPNLSDKELQAEIIRIIKLHFKE